MNENPTGVTTINYNGNAPAFIKKYLRRNEDDTAAAKKAAEDIVDDVKSNGDAAVLKYARQFDKAELTSATMNVGQSEIDEAYEKIPRDLLGAIKTSISRVRRYHEKQFKTSWMETFGPGELMGQLIKPVASCGVYVPGGTAPLFSSLIMLCVPAKTAGVEELIVSTPCGADGKLHPAMIVAARETGVDEIYKIGGAQAIAAMAFGTETVPKVDKIVGPGSIYTIMAKRAVFGYVGIDSLPGPSEIVIVADDSAKAAYVAADMLSQAEHGERSMIALVTDSIQLADSVQTELASQTAALERKKIIEASLERNGLIIIVEYLFDAVSVSNELAPEHLAIQTRDPFSLATRVKNAGAVFLGHFTPEPLGDYIAGPSHVLPTDQTAKFFSPVSVDDFLKKTSVISFDREAMLKLKSDTILLAEAEGLTAHANALKVRE